MKKRFFAPIALSVFLAGLLCGCSSKGPDPTPTPLPSATPAVTATVAPMLSPDPEDGAVTDEDGVLGNEPEATILPGEASGRRR